MSPDKPETRKRKLWNEPSLYPVSDDHGIYMCRNANITDHRCTFALCQNCYFQNAPSRKRNRKNQFCASDDGRCDHTNYSSLVASYDGRYFTSKHKQMVIDKGIFSPSKCYKCHLEFVKVLRDGNVD